MRDGHGNILLITKVISNTVAAFFMTYIYLNALFVGTAYSF